MRLLKDILSTDEQKQLSDAGMDEQQILDLYNEFDQEDLLSDLGVILIAAGLGAVVYKILSWFGVINKGASNKFKSTEKSNKKLADLISNDPERWLRSNILSNPQLKELAKTGKLKEALIEPSSKYFTTLDVKLLDGINWSAVSSLVNGLNDHIESMNDYVSTHEEMSETIIRHMGRLSNNVKVNDVTEYINVLSLAVKEYKESLKVVVVADNIFNPLMRTFPFSRETVEMRDPHITLEKIHIMSTNSITASANMIRTLAETADVDPSMYTRGKSMNSVMSDHLGSISKDRDVLTNASKSLTKKIKALEGKSRTSIPTKDEIAELVRVHTPDRFNEWADLYTDIQYAPKIAVHCIRYITAPGQLLTRIGSRVPLIARDQIKLNHVTELEISNRNK